MGIGVSRENAKEALNELQGMTEERRKTLNKFIDDFTRDTTEQK